MNYSNNDKQEYSDASVTFRTFDALREFCNENSDEFYWGNDGNAYFNRSEKFGIEAEGTYRLVYGQKLTETDRLVPAYYFEESVENIDLSSIKSDNKGRLIIKDDVDALFAHVGDMEPQIEIGTTLENAKISLERRASNAILNNH